MNIRLLEPAQAELDEAIAWYAEQAQDLVKADERYAFDSGLRTFHLG